VARNSSVLGGEEKEESARDHYMREGGGGGGAREGRLLRRQDYATSRQESVADRGLDQVCHARSEGGVMGKTLGKAARGWTCCKTSFER